MGDTTPGMVCGHHHLYSALARGMPAPPVVPTTFLEVLEQVWWRLDVALDLEMIAASARLGALEALECGTTAIVDHHESPSAIEGSLDVIAAACREVGVRAVCAYGVTDRHGPDGARRGLEENERFIRAGGHGMVGVHAAFTCTDATLEAAAGLAQDVGAGVHIHVAEGQIDADAGRRLARLAKPGWVLAHGVHLDRTLPGTLAHNPRSNMTNSVGYANPAAWPGPIVLGSDGVGADMLEEFRLAFARAREADITVDPAQVWQWAQNGWELVPEARDDRVRWSYNGADDPWKLAFTPGVRAREVWVGGEQVLSEGRPTRVDPDEVRRKAAEQAAGLFARL
jgi:cytosine/adenosine deaminase-related metal-dependent hydrolase